MGASRQDASREPGSCSAGLGSASWTTTVRDGGVAADAGAHSGVAWRAPWQRWNESATTAATSDGPAPGSRSRQQVAAEPRSLAAAAASPGPAPNARIAARASLDQRSTMKASVITIGWVVKPSREPAIGQGRGCAAKKAQSSSANRGWFGSGTWPAAVIVHSSTAPPGRQPVPRSIEVSLPRTSVTRSS